MKVRSKKTGVIGHSYEQNIHSLSEVIVCWEDDRTTEFICDLDVYIVNAGGIWVDMQEAFAKQYLITDNMNVKFREPTSLREKAKGYYD
jgi:hypothetical protein